MSTLTIAPTSILLPIRGRGVDPVRIGEKRTRRALASVAASLAALVVAGTLLHGYQSSRPAPDLVTFAFRV